MIGYYITGVEDFPMILKLFIRNCSITYEKCTFHTWLENSVWKVHFLYVIEKQFRMKSALFIRDWTITYEKCYYQMCDQNLQNFPIFQTFPTSVISHFLKILKKAPFLGKYLQQSCEKHRIINKMWITSVRIEMTTRGKKFVWSWSFSNPRLVIHMSLL